MLRGVDQREKEIGLVCRSDLAIPRWLGIHPLSNSGRTLINSRLNAGSKSAFSFKTIFFSSFTKFKRTKRRVSTGVKGGYGLQCRRMVN